ncbi:MAG: Na+/H+ antiporter NhaA [Acidobacteriota bacterium]|nr:Na+/H+ antiporter NhaA [Acidobacteriota bacterium]
MHENSRPELSPFASFLRSEAFSGALLVLMAVCAFVWANSRWAPAYDAVREMVVGVRVGEWALQKPLLLWINDGLMAIFFLFVGLEIKREVLIGELADVRAATLPIAGAAGGMIVPALIYAALNWNGPGLRGWGVPMATDIAFALGIMALAGSRVPIGLKIFLTAVAIVDDLGAVLVIALFYTESLSLGSLAIAGGVLAAGAAYGWRGGANLGVYGLLGAVLWYFMLQSGVHATVAGVLLAMTIPIARQARPDSLRMPADRVMSGEGFEQIEVRLVTLEQQLERIRSPLHELEHALQPWVAYGIMPVFALCNAGFTLSADVGLAAPVALGSLIGLVAGKPIGIGLFCWLAVGSGRASLPVGAGWGSLLATACLCGIGFTMALFIASLAFGTSAFLDQAKLGVLLASAGSAALGMGLLFTTLPARPVRGAADAR